MSTTMTGPTGETLLYDPDSRWTQWNIGEIYLGQSTGHNNGKPLYVPKVNDYVIDPETNKEWKVESVDQTSYIPVLVPVITIQSSEFGENDTLLGVGPGTPSDTYRVYVDKSTMPYSVAVDARLIVYGSMVSTAKMFVGSLLTGNEKCVSALYDNSGNLISQTIPLEQFSTNYTSQTTAIRTVPIFNTTEELADGEIITIVFYSDLGHVVSKRQLLVENTSYIRSTDRSVKYISSIALDTPFLSRTDPKAIKYPLNVPLSGMALMGIVNYSDGSSMRIPVDGTKFEILGFENFVSTIPDQDFPVVLKYNLSPGEVVYGCSVAGSRFKTETYRAITQKAEGSYSLKLYVIPVWIDSVRGYRLDWYLYNLDRNSSELVTPHVHIDANSNVFDPILYGINQHLRVSINIKDINPAFNSYVHVQTVDISLINAGNVKSTNWTIAYEPNQSPRYGVDNCATTTFFNQNLSKLKIDMGLTDFNSWLERLYLRGKPIYDSSNEIGAPTPTHFSVTIGEDEVIYPITQWNSAITLNSGLTEFSTLIIKFIKRVPNNDIQLGVAGIPVYQSN